MYYVIDCIKIASPKMETACSSKHSYVPTCPYGITTTHFTSYFSFSSTSTFQKIACFPDINHLQQCILAACNVSHVSVLTLFRNFDESEMENVA